MKEIPEKIPFSENEEDSEFEKMLEKSPEFVSMKNMVNETTEKTIKEMLKQTTDGNNPNILSHDGVLDHLGDYIEEPFQILESYFRGQYLERLVRHQIESYNHFINYQIQRTIQMFNPLIVRSENDYVEQQDKYMLEIQINFINFKMYSPQIYENNGATKTMFPQEAKLRNFTYASAMVVDIQIQYIIRNTTSMDNPRIITKTLSKINIGKMPIMLKSSICVLTQSKYLDPRMIGECPMDCGGYFIIKGSEKIVLGQERAAENRVYCFFEKNTTKWDWYAEVKSVPDTKCISPKQIEVLISSKNNGFGKGIYVNIPRIKKPIELFVIFRAMGVLSDKSICQYILLDVDHESNEELLKLLQASIIDGNKYMTKEEALQHITAYVAYTPINMEREKGQIKKREFAIEVIENDLFPHCKTHLQKLYYLGYMVKKLLQTSIGLFPTDDRDSYVNKRVELTGTLLNNLFRNYFNKLVKEMQKQIIREINNGSWRSMDDFENIINMTNIYKIMKSTTIENSINRALATGDFSIKQSNSSKVGVAQVLNRMTYMASLSHLRRINTPLENSGELIAPRKLHNTTWGYLCITGDTDILLSNCIDSKKMRNIKDGDKVNTVNRKSLQDEPSYIHSYFSKMPDKLFEITTISGRKIKATAEHPFLVNTDIEKYKMIKLENLKIGDKVVIRHMTKHIADENRTVVCINNSNENNNPYITELINKKLIGCEIPIDKLKIIARLLGVLKSSNELYASDNIDISQIIDDIQKLGFESPPIRRETRLYEKKLRTVFKLDKTGAFGHFLDIMSCDKIGIPSWLMNAEQSIKREFLSSFQGSIGSNICVLKLKNTNIFTMTQELEKNKTMVEQIVTMFQSFGIDCKVVIKNMEFITNTENILKNCEEIQEVGLYAFYEKTIISTDLSNETAFYYLPKPTEKSNSWSCLQIQFNNQLNNLIWYSDIINYTYNNKKRYDSSINIEYIKYMEHSKENYYDDDYDYDEFIYEVECENGCVSVPLESIVEIPPEPVFDFTTMNDNHDFVASSFVVSNCAIESPEGASIGIVKNISYMAHITIPTTSTSLYDLILPQIIQLSEDKPTNIFYKKTKVFINGCWVGITEQPMELYNEIKDKKHRGIINIYTSIVFDFKLLEIRICNDGGRFTRPVLRVKNNRAILTLDIVKKLERKEIGWNDLLTNCRINESVLEYIDVEEQCHSIIAMKSKDHYLQNVNAKINYNYCEIHPSTIFGILASCIPFPENNQAPRNTYQTCQAKQAIGVYALNFDKRMDKTAHVLTYPSKPLVETRLLNFIKLNNVPSGHQIHVAIMTYTGYNQEDSILINKGSIDRGLFMETLFHTEKDTDENIIRDEIIRCKPDPEKTKGVKFGNYAKLDSNGFVPENTFIQNRDVIIAKIVPIKENRNDPTKTIKYEDQSRIYKTDEETYIDKNYTGRNGDGYNQAKVRLRTLRKPVIGDKFSSKAGQKSTVGLIVEECNMPFTKNGLRPDIILNPHAIPSRMTIAQLKETLLGKVLLELGLFGDGTSFGNMSIRAIINELQKVGYESYGNEIMYDGMTGEQLEASIFIGPTYYMRLKHMVNDKVHSRSTGAVTGLTRQACEGRSINGGLRVGEMEKDALLSHGMSNFLRDRFYNCADKFEIYVCNCCGLSSIYNDGSSIKNGNGKNKKERYGSDMSIHLCKTCNNTTDFSKVQIPFACKLLFQELQAINVVPRIITEG